MTLKIEAKMPEQFDLQKRQIKMHLTYLTMHKAFKTLVQSMELVSRPEHSEKMLAVMVDSNVLRFRYCFDLILRLLRQILEVKFGRNIKIKTILPEAYKVGFIKDENTWGAMWKDRFLINRTDDETFSEKLYKKIATEYFSELSTTLKRLEAKVA